ncbi:branched-chain amino acid ABC transporter permease [Caldilinea sp.]|jgi:branched-chain amino acid transport system permease protein|uniref:branched-chain amino acid ABC transporter permease n=1 Tax=Caldilinea sp. TaxID=2293560 RepID=UPI001B2C642F|nr:branched-chain amino acid ABC transporter permease [Caldilinea sp.]MBO9391994.1 branched-chain amino acid ABC transporter permease [Caldilinea sp.]
MAVLRPAGDFDRSYAQDMLLLRQPWQRWAMALIVVGVALIPLFGNAYLITTVNRIMYSIVAVQGLNVLTGMTGQISLGQAAFMLVGGYIVALTAQHWGLPIFVTLPLAALGTGVFGLIFGLPSLRVKGFYLAMATLAAQFIIPWLSRHIYPEYLGGSSGRIAVPSPVIFGITFNQVAQVFYISLAVLVITTILLVNIRRTKLGRSFIAVRDNDLAAEVLGVNPFGVKLRAFFVAAMLAGLAGGLKAISQRSVGTELAYGLNESILLLGMLVIGGLGHNLGPFLGVATIVFLEDLANVTGSTMASLFPAHATNLLTSFRPLFFGLVLMLFLIFEPRGLAHRWEILKATWRMRPFSR